MRAPTSIVALSMILVGTAAAPAQPGVKASVKLSGGTQLPPNPSLPTLELTNQQREQIRKAVLTEQNDIQFRLAATRPAKDFTPAIGAKLPGGVKAQALPATVLSQIPQLRDYWYVKMKDQVLIVDGMTNKIVDVFSGTQPVT